MGLSSSRTSWAGERGDSPPIAVDWQAKYLAAKTFPPPRRGSLCPGTAQSERAKGHQAEKLEELRQPAGFIPDEAGGYQWKQREWKAGFRKRLKSLY